VRAVEDELLVWRRVNRPRRRRELLWWLAVLAASLLLEVAR
jgi:hypothetical protein